MLDYKVLKRLAEWETSFEHNKLQENPIILRMADLEAA